MTFAGLIARNLRRRPGRAALTFGSLVVAFVMFGLLQPVVGVFAGGTRLASGNRLIVSPKHSISDMLPLRYVNRVKHIPGVAVVSHQTWFGGSYKDHTGTFTRWAVPPKSFLEVHPEFVLPEAARKAFVDTRTSAIVGRATARRYHMKVGDKIHLKADIWFNKHGANWTFDLVGIYQGANADVDTSRMFLNFNYFDDYRIVAPHYVSNLVVSVKHPRDSAKVAHAIDAAFANSDMETRTVTEQQYMLEFARQLGNLGLIARGILGAVFFTILLLTANTMSQSIRERGAELAILKVLGFSGARILALVLLEAAALPLTAAASGLALAALALRSSGTLVPQLPNLHMTGASVVLALLLALAVAAAAGLPPALRAAREDIMRALRRL